MELHEAEKVVALSDEFMSVIINGQHTDNIIRVMLALGIVAGTCARESKQAKVVMPFLIDAAENTINGLLLN